MLATVASVYSLLLGMGILLAGSGLLGTLLGLRAGAEGYSELLIGLIMSAFFVGYIVGSLVCPSLIRRVGHIRAFAALAAIASTASMLHGLIIDPVVWWVLRAVTGIAVLGLYMVIESWLNEQVRHHRGQVFAVYMMVSLIALGAGQFLILFYGPGALASFVLVGMLFSLGLLPVALTPVSQPIPVEAPHFPLKGLFRRSPVGFVGSLVSGLITGTFWGLSAVFALAVGLDELGVALFISAVIFGGALLQWPIGHLSDNRDRRVVLVVVCLLGAIAATAIFAVAGVSTTALLVAAVLYGGFSFTLYALSVAHTHDRVDVHHVLEATRGLLLLNGIGAALGPILAGLIMHFTDTRTFPLVLGVLLVILALFIQHRIRIDRPVVPEEQGEFVPVTRTSPVAAELDPRTDMEPELELNK
ncbi:MFS transporter [Thioalkalivibrio denitrificans]|uniref:MFS transporter n=1 Tax=Thioalkalivibrio denitrificans TaxID=108003 RepID=A0A1V3NJZ6_9GAMM|nr:MFS transporter [Thioalkalivibrio denitrificans]OOG25375.1 MFS transporter [Thioalkalivibrio denitrificans]